MSLTGPPWKGHHVCTGTPWGGCPHQGHLCLFLFLPLCKKTLEIKHWKQLFLYEEALHGNTGNNWTDTCSESSTNSHVTGIS